MEQISTTTATSSADPLSPEQISGHDRAKEAAAYLREYAVLRRLMEGFRDKYVSYGRFGGSVLLEALSAEDIDVLEGFFQTGFHGEKQVRITAVKFQKALAASRFAPATPEEVLREYFGAALQGKKQRAEERKNLLEAILDQAENIWKKPAVSSWIRHLREDPKHGIHYYLRQKLPFEGAVACSAVHSLPDDTDRAEPGVQDNLPVLEETRHPGRLPLLYQMMDTWRIRGGETGSLSEEQHKALFILVLGVALLEGFPCRRGTFEYLPVFAAKITGDPHFFDQGSAAGSFLDQIARWMNRYEGKALPSFRGFESLRRQRIYLSVGIIQGDSSNYTMLYGLRAYGKEGQVHQGMDGFMNEMDMVQIPLHVIENWTAVSCPDQKIWIVENPSVYSVLCQHSAGRYACMCVNGQPNLSSLRMLDLLALSGVSVYYAGDFDPEGLRIAQNLRRYYRGTFHYWHMSAEDYHAALSSVELTPKRLKMLQNIRDPELIPVTRKMLENGRAGYQENIWERYLPEPAGSAGKTPVYKEKKSMDHTYFKMEIYIPELHFPVLQKALQEADAGHIGNYDCCLSFSRVTGQWRPLPGTDPYLGTENEICQAEELKVEVTVRGDRLEDTLRAVKAVHPYEEPVINVIPLYRTGL